MLVSVSLAVGQIIANAAGLQASALCSVPVSSPDLLLYGAPIHIGMARLSIRLGGMVK